MILGIITLCFLPLETLIGSSFRFIFYFEFQTIHTYVQYFASGLTSRSCYCVFAHIFPTRDQKQEVCVSPRIFSIVIEHYGLFNQPMFIRLSYEEIRKQLGQKFFSGISSPSHQQEYLFNNYNNDDYEELGMGCRYRRLSSYASYGSFTKSFRNVRHASIHHHHLTSTDMAQNGKIEKGNGSCRTDFSSPQFDSIPNSFTSYRRQTSLNIF